MNESSTPRVRPPSWKLSIRGVLAMTALAAVALSNYQVFRERTDLRATHQSLTGIVSQLVIDDSTAWSQRKQTEVIDGFETFEVYVPESGPRRLYLAAGLTTGRIPPPDPVWTDLEPGRHRISLATHGKPAPFRYWVYVDGNATLTATMPDGLLPHGFTSSSSMRYSSNAADPKPIVISSRKYNPRYVFKNSRTHFDGHTTISDASQPAYSLWVASPSQRLTRPSRLVESDVVGAGVGWRDGIRYITHRNTKPRWSFAQIGLQSPSPCLVIEPRLFNDDRPIRPTDRPLDWTFDVHSSELNPDAVSESIVGRLKTTHDGKSALFQMQFDTGRPGQVGLRYLPEQSDAPVTRIELAIVDGTRHLWRQLRTGNHAIDSSVNDPDRPLSDSETIALSAVDDSQRIDWQTDLENPLQFLNNRFNPAAGFARRDLYPGLPARFTAEIPNDSKSDRPTNLRIKFRSRWDSKDEPQFVDDDLQPIPAAPIPGGPIIDQIIVPLDPNSEAGIWFDVQPQNSSSITSLDARVPSDPHKP